jgi:IS5 family transposase
MTSPLGLEGIEVSAFRTIGDQPRLWEAILLVDFQALSGSWQGLTRRWTPTFFVPFAPFFDPRIDRPSTPMETYLRMMVLKFRYHC